MNTSRWKMAFIVFLVFLAIYQTIGIWFGNFSGHNLIYSMKDSSKNIEKAEQLYMTESIFINTGENKFIRKYNNIATADYKKMFDKIIDICIKKGEGKYIEKFNQEKIIDNKAIIYTYSFDIEVAEMSKIFNLKNKNLSKIEKFDTIAIVLKEDNNLETIFISTEKSEAYELSISKENLNENIIDVISDLENIQNKDYYFIATEKNYKDYFKKNQFLPKPKNEVFSINQIFAINPLEKAGGILLTESEKYINIFFENPTIKSSSFINNTYTYNDENIVVKYYTNGVLEYINYKSAIGKNDDTPYKIALNFLKRDTNIKNEYYLTNYKVEDNKTTFYFDYKINNFPIILSEKQKQETNMESLIEIEIENNKVSKYRKFVYDFSLEKTYKTVEKSFEEAIENILTLVKEPQNLQTIDEMKLGYIFDEINELTDISWVLSINNKTYIEDIGYGD